MYYQRNKTYCVIVKKRTYTSLLKIDRPFYTFVYKNIILCWMLQYLKRVPLKRVNANQSHNTFHLSLTLSSDLESKLSEIVSSASALALNRFLGNSWAILLSSWSPLSYTSFMLFARRMEKLRPPNVYSSSYSVPASLRPSRVVTFKRPWVKVNTIDK